MPVFLTEEQFAPWLGGEAGKDVLKPAPSAYLQRWPVSKRVNSSKADADDASLIEALPSALGNGDFIRRNWRRRIFDCRELQREQPPFNVLVKVDAERFGA